MTCFFPLEGWRSRHPSDSGKFGIVFNKSKSNGQKVEVPCGQCIGCRLDRAKDWSLRIMHESQMHAEMNLPSAFLTLTYRNPDSPLNRLTEEQKEKGLHIHIDCGLHHDHFQKFMKRYRKRIAPNKIKFYMCGEYGEEGGRPHYHAIIFGHDFSDKKLHYVRDGKNYYKSKELDELWQYGNCTIADCTVQSAGYVARYIMKKCIGEESDEHYKTVGLDGRFHYVKHEYTCMSGGIGKSWFKKYSGDCKKDFITLEGKRYRVPRYYDRLREQVDEDGVKAAKRARKLRARKFEHNQTPERLRTREKCTAARVKRLVRPLG